MIAIAFSLGLASSVLWLGAVGDRYGRKMLLIAGTSLAVPASLIAAWAPSIGVLILARLVGGFAAGMAFPTTARTDHRAVVGRGTHALYGTRDRAGEMSQAGAGLRRNWSAGGFLRILRFRVCEAAGRARG